MRLADGMLLVVDACEGVMVVTERAIKQAIAENIPISLMLSKVGMCCLQWGVGVRGGRWWLCRLFVMFTAEIHPSRAHTQQVIYLPLALAED